MKRTLVIVILLALTACHVSPRSAMFDPYHAPSGTAVDSAGGDSGDGSAASGN